MRPCCSNFSPIARREKSLKAAHVCFTAPSVTTLLSSSIPYNALNPVSVKFHVSLSRRPMRRGPERTFPVFLALFLKTTPFLVHSEPPSFPTLAPETSPPQHASRTSLPLPTSRTHPLPFGTLDKTSNKNQGNELSHAYFSARKSERHCLLVNSVFNRTTVSFALAPPISGRRCPTSPLYHQFSTSLPPATSRAKPLPPSTLAITSNERWLSIDEDRMQLPHAR